MKLTSRSMQFIKSIPALRFFIIFIFVHGLIVTTPIQAKVVYNAQTQSVLFNNLPRVALLVKEQYVDPNRIKPDAMCASILESLELRITKLVITLPKTLEKALEQVRAVDDPKLATPAAKAAVAAKPEPPVKEQLIVDLGGTKKVFDFESQRSIWGMIFFLREVFSFVEQESKKQGLTEKSRAGEEPIDWEKIENGAINAMLSTLDPHSIYLEPKYARDLELTTKGAFGGIGIVISVKDGFLTVISPIDDTPAARANMKAGDRVIAINGVSAINMDLNEAVNMLRGKPDTVVKIKVQRQNPLKELEFALKRAIIKVDSVAYALLDKNIGYLRVKAFQGNTAQDVKNGILAMKKKSSQMNGLVLDLRGNPGGLLREAVEIANLFLDGGEVVSTKGARPDSRQVEMAQPGELDPKMKIVVLADGGSASASEIVASALKSGGLKGGRGIVVGQRTFGKGSVQMLFDFPTLPNPNEQAKASDNQKPKEEPEQPAALKLTIAEYFGPNNTSMQTIGVTPDIGLSAVKAEKREELKIFPEVLTREADLEGHLSTDKQKALSEEKPLVTIEYLAPKEDEQAVEYGKLDLNKLKKDFAVAVASDFIRAAKDVSRSEMLAHAQTIRDRLQTAEQKKITDALKKYAIDWSDGPHKLKDGLKASISKNPGAVSGNKMKVAVKVKNTSAEPFYQVHGITHSKTPLFDQKEFLFGKLLPNQEIERMVEFEIPKDVISRKDLMTLELRDSRREKLSELDIPLDIKGLSRPRFAHLVYIDDSRGNGDGKVQSGEEVELNLWLKNIGEGKAFEPTVLLRNESGANVFLKNGRYQSKELLPNQEISMKFAFTVKEATEKAEFELQIFDGQMHDLWRDKIAVPLGKKLATHAVNQKLIFKEDAPLLDGIDATAKKIASLRLGLHVAALKEVDDFYYVKVANNLSGFVKKAALNPLAKADAQKKENLFTVNYDRIPAQVSLKFGDGSGISKTENGKVVAEVDDVGRLSSLLLYVNNKKVLYEDVGKAKGKEKLEHTVTLKPGINVITILASEDSTYGQRESITVFYDDAGKIIKPVAAPVAKTETK